MSRNHIRLNTEHQKGIYERFRYLSDRHSKSRNNSIYPETLCASYFSFGHFLRSKMSSSAPPQTPSQQGFSKEWSGTAENCLLQQEFVKDSEVSVEQYMNNVAKSAGVKVRLVDAVRFEKGEGIENQFFLSKTLRITPARRQKDNKKEPRAIRNELLWTLKFYSVLALNAALKGTRDL